MKKIRSYPMTIISSHHKNPIQFFRNHLTLHYICMSIDIGYWKWLAEINNSTPLIYCIIHDICSLNLHTCWHNYTCHTCHITHITWQFGVRFYIYINKILECFRKMQRRQTIFISSQKAKGQAWNNMPFLKNTVIFTLWI